MKGLVSAVAGSCLVALAVTLLFSLSSAGEREGEQKGIVKPRPQIQVTAPPKLQVVQPDLTVFSFKVPYMKFGNPSPIPSDFVAVIKNIGDGDSGPFPVLVTCSPVPGSGSPGVPLGPGPLGAPQKVYTVNNLKPGEVFFASMGGASILNFFPGKFKYEVKVDFANAVKESNEGNNSKVITVQVQPK